MREFAGHLMDLNDAPYAAVTAALIGLAMYFWHRWGPKPDDAWKEFASAHGLTHAEGGRTFLSGELGGHQVRLFVEPSRGEDSDWITILRVRVSPPLPTHLLLAYGRATGLDNDVRVPREERLGVETFDKTFVVDGLTPEVRAVLSDHRLQQTLIELCQEHFVVWIEEGWLHVEHFGQRLGSAQELEDFTRPVLEAAHQITATAARVSVKRPND